MSPTRFARGDLVSQKGHQSGGVGEGVTAQVRVDDWGRATHRLTPTPAEYLERGDYNPSLVLALQLSEHFSLPIDAIFSLKPFEPLSDLLDQDRA